MTSCDAAPADTVMVPDVALVSDGAVKLNVRAPAVPVIERFANVATPLAIAAVTTTPAWLTGLLDASCSWITGCCANGTPLCAEADGCTVTASWLAAPAVTLIGPDVAEVSDGAVNDSVRVPTVPV